MSTTRKPKDRPATPQRSASRLDWLGPLIVTARTFTAGTEAIPIPYVRAAFGSVLILLETVERMKKNRNDLEDLCKNAIEIMAILQEQITSESHAIYTAAAKLEDLCWDFHNLLQTVVLAVEKLQSESLGVRGHVKEFLTSRSISEDITRYQKNVQELGLRIKLVAAIDTNVQVHKIHQTLTTVIKPNLPILQATEKTNTCPPPSRIFQGRELILNKMHQFFATNKEKQHIYVLHGLGGVGKTQIALKFIKELSSDFSDRFFVDTSTNETIDASLKNIAVAKCFGNSAKDGLLWLTSNVKEWLLFFDNADDPTINLNAFIPQCDHGNIIITSRNPGLCVYAGEHSQVSDMIEEEAVALLLRSAAQGDSFSNCQVAAKIVKAGAFISKSGALDTYLDLYTKNRAQLFSEKPAQSHDHYAWTVYTTWQMSFAQLSQLAATFLQLCSFLHYQGISEEIFSNASKYKFRVSGPSEEELQKPLEFLAHFLEPPGEWNSFRFWNITSEIKAYSLIRYDAEQKMFSIHPLVHAWTRTTVTDTELYHSIMGSILGMAVSEITDQDIQFASPKFLPHVELVLHEKTENTADFRAEYAWIFSRAGKYKQAEKLQIAVLDKQTKLLGDSHLDTLAAMFRLALTYWDLGEFKKAEKLEIVLAEKRKRLLGVNHPDTLLSMSNLGWTSKNLGKFKKAEKLQLFALEKQKQLLGVDHLDTLTTMGQLAATYNELGEFTKAENLEAGVLEKRKQLLGDNHPDTLRAMGNLAVTSQKLNKFKRAEELQIFVAEKQTQHLGDNHPNTLRAIANLAVTFRNLGKLKEAEELEVTVLDKRTQLLGINHPDTLRSMANLARTCRELGELKKAEKLEVAVFEKRKQVLGDNHPDSLLAMGNLASTYNNLGEFSRAEELEILVLEKRKQVLGGSHPDTLLAMKNLILTYRGLDKLQEAEELEKLLENGTN